MAATDRDSNIYQYTPLPSEKFIRLLELYPGQKNDSINFTLHQVEFTNTPSFENISYAWGDPANKTNVLCDGKFITVTRNLEDALLRLRLRDKSRILWADAICINQKDDVEKGVQVGIMQKIYSHATRICVWLGCTTPSMLPAFGLIDQILSYDSSVPTRRSS